MTADERSTDLSVQPIRAAIVAQSTSDVDAAATRPQATSVDVSATDAINICQAEGVLMELLQVDAAEALSWLTSTAAQRGQPVKELAAEVVEHRSI
jgi:AmiR/NasT family two-component response regulator